LIKDRFNIHVFPLFIPTYENHEFVGGYNIMAGTYDSWDTIGANK